MRKTAAEKRYLARVASLGCALCRRLGLGETPAEVHHARSGQGMGQRASHYDTIPLCTEHHRGDSGIHSLGRRFQDVYGCTEKDLLTDTQEQLK